MEGRGRGRRRGLEWELDWAGGLGLEIVKL